MPLHLEVHHRSVMAARPWLALALLVGAASCSKTSASRDKPAGLPPAAPGTVPAVAPAPAGGEVETVPAAPDTRQTISGTITLPAARRADVKKGDAMFLIARKSDGPGGLLAVQRMQAGVFPMPFTLSSRDAMIPGTPFEGRIAIRVRVDKDGDPVTRRKGDVYGQANGIAVGTQDVQVSLDTVQKDDVTLGGPTGPGMPAGHGGLPPGHP
jgi:cytochrome c-type biogenesis protein CcmH